MVFDDTFEHEAYFHDAGGAGGAPRVVLLFDVWHPDLRPAELRAIDAVFSDMRAQGLLAQAAGGKA
jgi:hypothetical protein